MIPRLPPWPDWAGDRTRCPDCLRPLASPDDEAIWQNAETPGDIPSEWGGPDAPALCWVRYGGECQRPEWFEDVTPLEVLQLRAIVAADEKMEVVK